MKNVIILISIVFCTGCAGSVSTRFDRKEENTYIIGAYPYQAVYEDINYLPEFAGLPIEMETLSSPDLWSIPGDFILDTILLPFDLLGWMFGLSKPNNSFANH